MARLVGPDEGSRLVYRSRTDGALTSAAGMTATVYSDQAGSVPANILTIGGAAIPGSQLTVSADSLMPLFQFPDGVDTVYVSVNGGPVTAVYARVDDRLDATARSAEIASYTTPGPYTWTKPTGARLVEVITIAGGGGGGSGRRGAAGTVRTGGGGGGGGGVTRALLNAADLPATCPIVVGTGAGGGSAAAVTDNSNGVGGGTGGHSTFNSTEQASSNSPRVRAGGGAPGVGGGVGQSNGGGGGFALFSGASGGNSNATGLVGSNGGDTAGGGGGGAGGGITTGDVHNAGSPGGVNSTLDQFRAAAGAVPGGVGEIGRATLSMGPGNGAGGGAASTTGAAGAGGQGGPYGGGGGGGGASVNGSTVGAGGRGGDGAVFVITYF